MILSTFRQVAFIIFMALPMTTPTSLSAEYRAYELAIENSDTGQRRTVRTTLDPLQYPAYYPVGKQEHVIYLDSWMCWENTSGFKEICNNPILTEEEAKPTSESARTPAAN